MLTGDLVRARRRGAEIHPAYLKGDVAARLLPVAGAYIDLYQSHVGQTREALDDALDAVDVGARDRVAAMGLRKVLEDAATFEGPEGADPEAIRREVMWRAAEAYRGLGTHDLFDREAVIARAAEALGLEKEALLANLYGDLKSAERLVAAWPGGAESLIARYNVALAQSVLLRATKVVLLVSGASREHHKRLFRTIRFLGLLHQVTPHTTSVPELGAEGAVYAIAIDGPFSLFGPSVRYGLRLASLLHAVLGCPRFFLRAEVLWGMRKEPLVLTLSHEAGLVPFAAELPEAPQDLEQLKAAFERLESDWSVRRNDHLFAPPGQPVVIPDLVFEHKRTKEKVYLEAFGYWSRDAVWRRVEQVRGGFPARLILAIRKDLRVSADVLSEEDAGEIYVYKTTMSPRAVLARLSAAPREGD